MHIPQLLRAYRLFFNALTSLFRAERKSVSISWEDARLLVPSALAFPEA
jgi:hypothetical protein